MTGNLHPERVRHLQSYLCGHSILDAGCGGGAFVEYLAGQGFDVTGVDYHEMFLEVARSKAEAKGIYIQGDITNLPFPDKSFDCTYCFDVLEHIDDQKALRELLRVTRNRVILAVPATDLNNFQEALTFYHYQDLTHLRTYTRESLAELFHSLGQQHFEIFPEIPVDFRHFMFRELAHDPLANSGEAHLQNLLRRVLRRLLSYARLRTVYTGLAATIILEAPHPTVVPTLA